MIIKYIRRNEYEVVNKAKLKPTVFMLKDALKNNDMSLVKDALDNLKSVVPFDEKVGVLIGFKEDGVIYIGFSKCNMDYDDFSKDFGYEVALDRAYKYAKKFENAGIPIVPKSVAREIPLFVDRCLNYYKDGELTAWVERYMEQ
jgi:hypothetical protein